jgi:large subunit ribosomal protein L20
MARVKRGVIAHRRHKKLLGKAKGYYNARRKVFRVAKQAVTKALQYAYIGRKQKKRNFRALWIVRINAAARQYGMSYSRLMNGLKKAGITVDRKVLADIAVHDIKAFGALADKAKASLAAYGVCDAQASRRMQYNAGRRPRLPSRFCFPGTQ